MFAVAFLGELNIDARCFGRNGGELDEAFGGAELTVFQLQSLRFHHSEQLLDCPARLVPTDDPPRLGRIGDVVRGQQPPMQRLRPLRRADFVHLDQPQLHCFGQAAVQLVAWSADLDLAESKFQHRTALGTGRRPGRQLDRTPPRHR